MISIKVNPHTVLNSAFSENVVYNLPDFPAYIKLGQLSTYPNFRTTSHWHDDFEFILLLDDELSYDVNGQHISLRAGEGIFINSQCFHYGYSDRYADCNFICILLSPHLLSVNEYFMRQFLDPLMQNTSFPYKKLIPAISWQNMILRDLLSLYRGTVVDMVRKVAECVFIPFTVGGGIRTVDDFRALLREGADKISINSSAINRQIGRASCRERV